MTDAIITIRVRKTSFDLKKLNDPTVRQEYWADLINVVMATNRKHRVESISWKIEKLEELPKFD